MTLSESSSPCEKLPSLPLTTTSSKNSKHCSAGGEWFSHQSFRSLTGFLCDCCRKKDPRSTSSRLTPLESVRFQTALYRLWFVCALYGRPAPANRGGRRNSIRHQPESLRELARALQSFDLVERVPLFEVWKFVVELATWAVRAEFLPQKSPSSFFPHL